MRIIDNKYQTSGDITKVDGTPIPDDEELILFRGQDKLLVPLLEKYRQMCVEAGSPEEHLSALDSRISAIKSWQEANQDKLRVPGTKPN